MFNLSQDQEKKINGMNHVSIKEEHTSPLALQQDFEFLFSSYKVKVSSHIED